MNYSDDVMRILKKRYLQEGETPETMFRRVAFNVGSAEKIRADQEYWTDQFYEMMAAHKFLPNSPTLMNAGTPIQQLSACFVLPVEDSMESIFEAVKQTALIHKSGGGTGFDFSHLRGKDSEVGSTGGIASGPLSFMTVFDAATETVKQGGKRRGANMAMLRADHPDILDFIGAKQDSTKLNNFNLSVAVTDDFMEDMRDGSTYEQTWNTLIKAAHATGEPGIVFIDAMNRNNPTPNLGAFEATNPCGEQPLLPYESCVLGSINLAAFIQKETIVNDAIDYSRLRECVHTAVRFLDNTIDVNEPPLPQIEFATKLTRKIGLGVMGFADMLLKLGIPYDSLEAVDKANELMSFTNGEARIASENLAKERGPYPAFKGDKLHPPIRNATRTTIAPTGTLAFIAGVSSGIEPVYAPYHIRTMDDATTKRIDHPDAGKDWFRAAHDIAPKWHVQIQAAFQKHTDNAVSKTINLPATATVQDVEDAFMLAWELGCKGITVYRDGSREGQVLQTSLPHPIDEDIQRRKADELEKVQGSALATRPDSVSGTTRKILTGCGNLYVTINEREGKPFELFARIGKAGGCAASQTEAIGRLVSLALRKGVTPYDIQQQLTGVRCSSPAKGVSSCADGVAAALDQRNAHKPIKEDDLTSEQLFRLNMQMHYPDESLEGIVPPADRHMGICTECSSNLIFQGGCMVCRTCGYSRC